MTYLHVNCSKKGQLKIQQMAFFLVAMILFFAMVALVYFSITYSSLKSDVEDLREQEVRELVRKMAGTPEFSWSLYDCDSCVDMDKIFALNNQVSYQGFWRNIPFLQIVRVYPLYGEENPRECALENYPECDTITLVDEDSGIVAHSSFVALCRYEPESKFTKCELGKIIMGFRTIG